MTTLDSLLFPDDPPPKLPPEDQEEKEKSSSPNLTLFLFEDLKKDWREYLAKVPTTR